MSWTNNNLDIQLHRSQLEVFKDRRRFRCLCSGRRWGKSTLILWELMLACLTFQGQTSLSSPEMVLGLMPSLVQAKKVLWKPLINLCETHIPHLIKEINKTDYRIDFYKRKPSILVAGCNSDDGDRLRGLRVYFAAMDEYADFKPNIFEQVIRPAMSDTKGSRALFTGTPKGRLNHFHDLVGLAKKFPEDYAFFSKPSYDNPTLEYAEALDAKRRLPPRFYRQEYLASFEDFPGKIYTELSTENFYYDKGLPKNKIIK